MTGRPINPETKTWYTNEQLNKIIAENVQLKKDADNIYSDAPKSWVLPEPINQQSVEDRPPLTDAQVETAIREAFADWRIQPQATVQLESRRNRIRRYVGYVIVVLLLVIVWTHSGPPLYRQIWDLFVNLTTSACATGIN